ncbi:MAG: hypothetical protein K8R79_12380 [Calditrichales bacterium]|nr:hypothetical protein [Calditrichales bacterium]
MKKNKIYLPKTIAVWTKPDSSKIIDSTNIFNYMNGAGELYLGYRFDHLEVYEYKAENSYGILTELYFMETSDDAFGLLSLDWGGDSVIFYPSLENLQKHSIAPSKRALYGRGLLRICSENLYARIMAYQETPESKEAVLSLGRAIAANRQITPEPELLNNLPLAFGSDWRLLKNRIGYFRSHLALNSLYYLSHQNILNMDLSTEAVTAPYENINDPENIKRIQFLFVKYAGRESARQALDHFLKTYLPEYKKDTVSDSITGKSHFVKIEDGWLGYKLDGQCIALVFGCPDQETARMMINQLVSRW